METFWSKTRTGPNYVHSDNVCLEEYAYLNHNTRHYQFPLNLITIDKNILQRWSHEELRNHYTWRVNTLTFKLKRFTVKKNVNFKRSWIKIWCRFRLPFELSIFYVFIHSSFWKVVWCHRHIRVKSCFSGFDIKFNKNAKAIKFLPIAFNVKYPISWCFWKHITFINTEFFCWYQFISTVIFRGKNFFT